MNRPKVAMGYTSADATLFADAIRTALLVTCGWPAGSFSVSVTRVDSTKITAVLRWPLGGDPAREHVKSTTFSPGCDEADAALWANDVADRAQRAKKAPGGAQ